MGRTSSKVIALSPWRSLRQSSCPRMFRASPLENPKAKKPWMAGSSPATTGSGTRALHRGEKPREAEAGEPGPDRLAAYADIPGADHRVGSADQIVDRQQADAAIAHRHAAVGGVIPV